MLASLLKASTNNNRNNSTAPNASTAVTVSKSLSSAEVRTALAAQMPTSSLDDRFAFVAVMDNQQQQVVWWPAILFDNYHALLAEFPIMFPNRSMFETNIALFQELLALLKHELPTTTTTKQQHSLKELATRTIAYLMGDTIPSGCPRIVVRHGYHPPKPLLTSMFDAQVLECSQYPGWKEAGVEAMSLYERLYSSEAPVHQTTATNTTATSSITTTTESNNNSSFQEPAAMSTTMATETTISYETQLTNPPSTVTNRATAVTDMEVESTLHNDSFLNVVDAPVETLLPTTSTTATTTTTPMGSATTNNDVSRTNEMSVTVPAATHVDSTAPQPPTTTKTDGADPNASLQAIDHQASPDASTANAAAAEASPSSESAAVTTFTDDDDRMNLSSPPDSTDTKKTSSSTASVVVTKPLTTATASKRKSAKSKKGNRAPLKTAPDVPSTTTTTSNSMRRRRGDGVAAATPKQPPSVTTDKKRKQFVHPVATTTTTTKKKPKTSSSKSRTESKTPRPVTPPVDHGCDRIPTFQQIKPILLKAEFTFRDQLFAFPKNDPLLQPTALLGRDYFESLSEFRANLCQYGVDDDVSWREEDRDLLHTWIRYHIVSSLQEGDPTPIQEGIDDRQAWKLLEHLGYRYAWAGYVVPGTDRKRICEVQGSLQNKFRDRLGHDGLYAHLARFGLPATTNALSPNELLSLELYLASGEEPNTFKRMSDYSLEWERLTTRPSTTERNSKPAKIIVQEETTIPKEVDSETPSSSLECTASQAFSEPEPRDATPTVSAAETSFPDSDEIIDPKDNDVMPLSTMPEHDEIKVPTFRDVQHLLEQVGFVFRESLYARPGMDPVVNERAEKGKDYFDSENEFRKHLCAYGIGFEPSCWKKEDATSLEDWVRFSIVTSLEGKSTIPLDKQLTRSAAWTLLKRVGYKFWTSHYCYFAPEVDRHTLKISQPGLCQNEFRDLDRRAGLFDHLARFGIQGHTSNLSTSDLLNLELFVASCHDASVFELKSDVYDPATSKSTRNRIANLSTTVASNETKGKNASRCLGSSQQGGDAKNADDGSASVAQKGGKSPYDNDAVAECQRSSRGSGQIRAVGRNIMSQLDSCAADDTAITVAAKLNSCIDALQGSSKLESLSILPNSRFHNQIREIEKFMQSFARSDNKKPGQSSLYVCGSPGVGKTCSILWCCEKETSHSNVNEIGHLTFCHINLGHLQSDPNGMETLMQTMADALDTTPNKVLKSLGCNSKPSRKLILVLDEIDLLVQERGSSRTSSKEKILENIFKWIENPALSFALIGISNSVANHRFMRLNSICKFHKKITFEPYGKHDLVKMIQDRIGTSVVDQPALEFAAAKVSTTSGDARQMLVLTAGAIQKSLDALSVQAANSTYSDSAPVVKMASMMLANRESIKQHADVVDGLPQMAKAVLCIAVTLVQSRSEETIFTLGMLRRYCLDCLEWEEEGFGIESFRDFIQQLIDSGLLKIHGTASEEFLCADVNQLHNVPICLSLQLQDVESVLETDLEDREFYRGLIQRARDISARL